MLEFGTVVLPPDRCASTEVARSPFASAQRDESRVQVPGIAGIEDRTRRAIGVDARGSRGGEFIPREGAWTPGTGIPVYCFPYQSFDDFSYTFDELLKTQYAGEASRLSTKPLQSAH